MRSMGLEEESNYADDEQNAQDEDADENAVESERGTPGTLDVSQIDVDVCQTLLDRFAPDKEIWELTPEDQLGVLNLEYISDQGDTGPVQTLKGKISKINEQVNSWQEELSKIPEIEEVADIAQLSRSQARERVELQKKRDTLEGKIEDSKNKLEELLEKLALEKVMKSQSRRIAPMGQDRHFRNYYWFHGNTGDDGVWIQDVGIHAHLLVQSYF
ncbi:unnamed protein product [Cylicostephanus goldi]|uniref:WHIM2 domain-containing protein n=1 Tax=Cylicostephanus goldi TaxID=71465 RepID=A0A3P6RFI7_CYLGO|nr:unnamed protein product [Cylicostephanus goldi]